MHDFYRELHLDRSETTRQLQEQLRKLEQTWLEREIANPDAAQEKLVIIRKAWRAFATDTTRADYDYQLEMANKKLSTAAQANDYEDRRLENSKKWYIDALNYFINHDEDLAKNAIERALQYTKEDDSNFAEINDRAASIYIRTKDYQTALRAVNNAILADPDNLNYLSTKNSVFSAIRYELTEKASAGKRFGEEAFNKIIDAYNKNVDDVRKNLHSYLRKARAQKDDSHIENALDLLAATYYWDYPDDASTAISYANEYIARLKERCEDGCDLLHQKSYTKLIFDDMKKKGILQGAAKQVSGQAASPYVSHGEDQQSLDEQLISTAKKFLKAKKDMDDKTKWISIIYLIVTYIISPLSLAIGNGVIILAVLFIIAAVALRSLLHFLTSCSYASFWTPQKYKPSSVLSALSDSFFCIDVVLLAVVYRSWLFLIVAFAGFFAVPIACEKLGRKRGESISIATQYDKLLDEGDK